MTFLKYIFIVAVTLIGYFGNAQNYPINYDSNPEKLEWLYKKMRESDSIALEQAMGISESYAAATFNYNKIKALALNVKFAPYVKKQSSGQLSDINFINSKLDRYQSDYDVKVIVRFAEESLDNFKTDLTKIILKLVADGKSLDNCIVAEVYGSCKDGVFDNAVGYKLHTLGEYSAITSLSNYSKLFKDPANSFQRVIFEDLDQLLFSEQDALAALSTDNAPVIGADMLSEAMQKAGAGACAFCKQCSQSGGANSGNGNISVGDGFTAPIKLIKDKNVFNCVIASYNSTNSTVVTSLPNNLNVGAFGNNKITPKGNQFVILKKSSDGEDEFVTCLATKDYSDFCSATNPFASQPFKEKVAEEISSCAQFESTAKQLMVQKYSGLHAKSLTYIYEQGYLVTKQANGDISVKQFSQGEYNQLLKDLKSDRLSANEAVVLKKTTSGYQLSINYGSNVVPKVGFEMNGTAVNKSELAFETVMNEYLLNKSDLSFADVQKSSGVFEDSKRIEIKETSFWDKVQNGLLAGREFIEQAQITPKYYNSANKDYSNNWVNTPPLLSGVGNGVIEEVKEIPQLVFLACDIATKEQVRTSIWEGLKGLTLDKVSAAAGSMISNWAGNYTQGGDGAWHQGGKDGVLIFTILNPAGLAKGADDALGKNLEEVADRVRKKGGVGRVLKKKPSWLPDRIIQGNLENPVGVIGVYGKEIGEKKFFDTKEVVEELNYPVTNAANFATESKDGFKLLNTASHYYKNAEQFWREFNKPWLDELVRSKADIVVLSDKSDNLLRYVVDKTGKQILENGKPIKTGFASEIDYLDDLVSKGLYSWDEVNGVYKYSGS